VLVDNRQSKQKDVSQSPSKLSVTFSSSTANDYLKQRESPAVYGVGKSEALVRTPERFAFWGRA